MATSTTTAEYQALYESARSAVWIQQLLKELSFPVSGPTRIHVDNNGCKSMSSNHRTDALTKHIDVKFHYTRDLVDENRIDIQYCPTNLMIADFLTKPTPARKFLWCRDALNIKDIRSRGDVGTD